MSSIRRPPRQGPSRDGLHDDVISLLIGLCSINIYIYIYIYTHTYIYIHIYVCVYVCIYVYISLSLYIYIYIHIHSKQYVIFISCIVYTYEYGQATTGCLGKKKRKTRRGTDGVSTNRVTAILLFDRGWISPYLGFPFRLGFARLKKLRGYD